MERFQEYQVFLCGVGMKAFTAIFQAQMVSQHSFIHLEKGMQIDLADNWRM
jgi:hypothetical protein